MQLLATDLLYPGRHCPGRLLDLKLTELDFIGPAQRLLALEINKQFARLMPRRDQRQRTDHERRQQEKVDARDHVSTAFVRSATRMVALRARGLAATSTSPARTARPTSLSGGCGSASLAMANLASRASPSNGRL